MLAVKPTVTPVSMSMQLQALLSKQMLAVPWNKQTLASLACEWEDIRRDRRSLP